MPTNVQHSSGVEAGVTEQWTQFSLVYLSLGKITGSSKCL